MKFSKEKRKRYEKYWKSLKGKPSKFKGKQNTEETKKQIRETVKRRWKEGVYDNRPNLSHKGKNNPSWKGGISLTKRNLKTKEYKKWRMDVFSRDNFTCQYCGIRGTYLEAHHIKSWADYPELRFVVSNGVTLCYECHKLTKKGRRKCIKKN